MIREALDLINDEKVFAPRDPDPRFRIIWPELGILTAIFVLLIWS